MKIKKTTEKNACGQNIRLLRKKNEITQNQLAARLQIVGINLEAISISRIEMGRRIVTDYELLTFAKIFRVKMEDLVEPDTHTE